MREQGKQRPHQTWLCQTDFPLPKLHHANTGQPFTLEPLHTTHLRSMARLAECDLQVAVELASARARQAVPQQQRVPRARVSLSCLRSC